MFFGVYREVLILLTPFLVRLLMFVGQNVDREWDL